MSDQKDGGRVLVFDPSKRRSGKRVPTPKHLGSLNGIKSMSIQGWLPERLLVRLVLDPRFLVENLKSISVIPVDTEGSEIWFECVVDKIQTVSETDTERVVQIALKSLSTQSNGQISEPLLTPGAEIALVFIADQFACQVGGQLVRQSILGAREALRTGMGRSFEVRIPGGA